MSDLCPVGVSSEVPNVAEDQPQTLHDASCLALKLRKYCDVIFTFPNLPDRIEAHELFLKIRSPVFEQIFRMRKSGNVQRKEIEISEATPEIFLEFLKFIYMDKFEVNVPGTLGLLHLAQKYKVEPLITKCEELLKADILMEHSVRVFETARRYGRHELVDRAGEIMINSLAYLIENGALANAEEGTVVYLLERDELRMTEVELFEFILKWGKRQVSHIEGDDLLRDKLKKVIPLIRYTNMTPHEFRSIVVPARLLSAEEVISVFCFFADGGPTRKDEPVMKFNTTPRNLEWKASVDFYAGSEDATPRSESTSNYPLKLCTSFQVQIKKKLWSNYLLKKPAITGIKVKWPSRSIQLSTMADQSLNFNVCVKDCSGPVNDQNVGLRFEKHLRNCKDGDENEIPVEPPVELVEGVTYCVIVEDQSRHTSHPCYKRQVNYLYSGGFSPYDLSPEASADLGIAELKFKEIQKDSQLSGFRYSTAVFPINVIRGIKISLV